ncbi:MAG: hypothetical protein KOO63_14765 [Bacteroidales bacterium]|nr:hypothetical protein [Candidatus Latescibacterota bacterium]
MMTERVTKMIKGRNILIGRPPNMFMIIATTCRQDSRLYQMHADRSRAGGDLRNGFDNPHL